MEKLFPYKDEGARLLNLIHDKGYTVYSFAKACKYSNARLYRICSGEFDIAGIRVFNAIIFARVLGFRTVDEFLEVLGIDLLKDIY